MMSNKLTILDNYSLGNYLGQNTNQISMDGLVISKSFYKEGQISNWHYHDNSYLTFIVKGGSQEQRRKKEFECLPGMLLFYPSKEIHKNSNYTRNSINIHVEFEDEWYKKFQISEASFQGESIINNPIIKCNLLKTLTSFNILENHDSINLESSIVNILTSFNVKEENENPLWVKKIYEILHDETNVDWTLQTLANKLNIHPVTISKNFAKYFHENIGDYIRKIKIEKSISLLSKKSLSLQEVATIAGFVDNAHFTKTFKKLCGISPSAYRISTLG